VDPSRGLVVPAVGPERGRDIDMGVEQWWRRNAMHGRVAYFRNAYRDLLEYLTRTQLPQAGVPAATAAAAQYGAYVNASSYTARGLEASFDARAGDRLRVSGSYTYLQATVTRALSATPVFNPAFPGVPIGAYAPLVGARPFRRPTHSGSVLATLHARATQVSAAVALVGARDDSTYLSDGFFGNSLLLPNRNLSPGYVRLDLALDQAVAQRVWGYVRVDNALDRPYAPAYGYPALPIAVRVGLRVSVGGRQGAP
jgi:iron complex outermembrane receptor protein/vitamin B12 transporter